MYVGGGVSGIRMWCRVICLGVVVLLLCFYLHTHGYLANTPLPLHTHTCLHPPPPLHTAAQPQPRQTPTMPATGDVVLVHDDSVLYDEVYGEQWGYGKLVSAVVETESGVTLGRVRDYMFSPDSGRISAIKYDAFGLPLLPASLVKTFSLGVDWVVAADVSKVIVRAGAEAAAVQETEGADWCGCGVNVCCIKRRAWHSNLLGLVDIAILLAPLFPHNVDCHGIDRRGIDRTLAHCPLLTTMLLTTMY